MSYRTLKRVLGETNFEVKALVLFGFGLTVLAVATFILYRWQTSQLIDDRNVTAARLMVAPMLQQFHYEWAADLGADVVEEDGEPAGVPDDSSAVNDPEVAAGEVPEAMDERRLLFLIQSLKVTAAELQPEDFSRFKFELSSTDPSNAPAAERPSDSIGYTALETLRQGEPNFIHFDEDASEYRYYFPVTASESCLNCHQHRRHRQPLADGRENVLEGDLIGMASVTLPAETVEASMHTSNALLITAEFVKVVLAILAIYLVVRYVITKPVMHLKKVSDAIAQGNLDMRADIRTGDEFEELSHAFNRMLRHMVTGQDELRELNVDLDGKVDELAHVNLQLYEMNNVKNEFLATMSHELRTPLNSILGFSDVLSAAQNLTEKQSRYVENIQTSGRNLMALINDVLDLAKIESGTIELHPAEFKMDQLIERQIGTMVPMAERRNIALSWSVEPNLPSFFQDAGKLQQILNNLVSNAIKFTPEGGRVRVTVESAGELCSLQVEDNGIGIPLDEQDRIFEKFRQGKGVPGQKDTLTRKYQGTGLGLSIVKELSRLLGGKVTLRSEFGKGSTFTVTFVTVLDDSTPINEEATSRLVGLNRFRTVDLPTPSGQSPSQQMTQRSPVEKEEIDPDKHNEQDAAPAGDREISESTSHETSDQEQQDDLTTTSIDSHEPEVVASTDAQTETPS